MANSLKMLQSVPADDWLTAEPEVDADTYSDDTDELPLADEVAVVTDEPPLADEASPFTDELPTVPSAATFGEPPQADEADGVAELCPVCGDLLAWHEQSCLSASASAPAASFLHEEPVIQVRTPAATFAYELGHRVQPTPASPAEVIWRGQLKERHPATGLIHRVNVYRLNDGYWDCYREEELQAA